MTCTNTTLGTDSRCQTPLICPLWFKPDILRPQERWDRNTYFAQYDHASLGACALVLAGILPSHFKAKESAVSASVTSTNSRAEPNIPLPTLRRCQSKNRRGALGICCCRAVAFGGDVRSVVPVVVATRGKRQRDVFEF